MHYVYMRTGLLRPTVHHLNKEGNFQLLKQHTSQSIVDFFEPVCQESHKYTPMSPSLGSERRVLTLQSPFTASAIMQVAQ